MPPRSDQASQALRNLEAFFRSYSSRLPVEQKALYLRSLRRDSAEMDREVDMALLKKIDRLENGLREAKKHQEQFAKFKQELEEEFKRLTGPPLYSATFIETQDHAGNPLAWINHKGETVLVAISRDFDNTGLETGDQVLISGDPVVLVDRVSCRPLETGYTGVFERKTPDGRFIISRRDEEIVVNASKMLKHSALKPGDLVRVDASSRFAYEKIERSQGEHYFLESPPPQSFESIGGLDHNIEEMKNVILLHFKHPEMARRYGLRPVRSILLVGPPGTGKTMLARALASWIQTLSGQDKAYFINVKPGSLADKYYGESERKVRELFRIAREAAKNHPELPVVIFFDEIETFAGTRGRSFNRVDDRLTNAFAAELEGFEDRGNILVISATNRRDLVDSMMLRRGRLTDLVLEVPRPNREAARQILSIYFREEFPYGPDEDKNDATREQIIESALSRLYSPNGESDVAVITFQDGSKRTVKARDIVSGATISKLFLEASRMACLRNVETGARGIRLEDVWTAIEKELEDAGRMLTLANCRNHLTDLPTDMTVLSIEPVKRTATHYHQYFQAA